MAEEIAPRQAVTLEVEHIDKNVATIALKDDRGTSTAYYLDPSNLNALLAELLKVVVRWANYPGPKAKTLSAEHQWLAVQRMELSLGRGGKELAARFYVGEIQFSFLLPLDSLEDAVGSLIPQLKTVQ